MSVKHDFSEKFEREEFYGKTVGKSDLLNFLTCLWKLQSCTFLKFIPYFHLFYTDGKATDQTRVIVSPNIEFIWEKKLKLTLHPVKFLDTIFPIKKQNKGTLQKTPSLISTEDFLNWLNEKWIDLGMDDTWYPIFCH